MASKNEDVHLRLFFDGAKAAKTYTLLIDLQKQYTDELAKARDVAKAKGIDPKQDPEVRFWKQKVAIIDAMLRETRKSYTDINSAIRNLSVQSIADLDSYIKYLEDRIKKMRLSGKGAAEESARLRAQLDVLRTERDSRNDTRQYRLLSDIQKDLANTDLTIDKLKRLRQELEHLRKFTTSPTTRRGATTAITELDLRLKQMTNTISQAKALAYDHEFVARTMTRLKVAPVEELERAMIMLRNRMKDNQTSLTDYIKASADLRRVKASLRGINQELSTQESFFTRSISKLMSYLGVFGGFYMLREQLSGVFRDNLKYDESLTNIRKTTGLTAEAVAMLADNIKRIDTRTTLQEMNDLAYSAGRLGVKGVDNIMEFVRAADKIKIALGEQLGENSQAIEQLMKITSIMGVQNEYGLEQAIERVGSSLNHLTMNSQATAQPMVNFMRRTAGVATQAGITSAELTGLAAAIDALGQPVEMSATSITKMLVQIAGKSHTVAEALKLTTDEADNFFYQVSTGQTMDALLMVLRKVNEAGGLSHLSTIVKDLGSEGQRVIQTIATLAENYEMVERMVRISNEAFAQGTSVTEEYNIKQQNTAALWDKLRNNFAKMMVSTDIVAYIQSFLLHLQALPRTFRDVAIHFEPLLQAMKSFIVIVTECTSVFTGLIGAMMVNAVFSKTLSWFTGLATSASELVQGARMATTSWRGFFMFMRTASFGNVFTAALTVVFTLINKIRTARAEARQAIEENVGLLERTKAQASEVTATINTLISRLASANQGTVERRNIIESINSTYGEYIGYQLSEASNNEAIAQTLRQVNKELQLKALLEGKAQMNEEVRATYRDQVGLMKTGLIDQIAEFITGPSPRASRAVASVIANRLIEMQADGTRYGASLVEAQRDDRGEVESYRRYGYTVQSASLNAYRQLIEGIITEFNTANQTRVGFDQRTQGGYIEVMDKLIAYLNTEAQRDRAIARRNVAWDDEIEYASAQARAQVEAETRAFWDAIKEVVSQGGKYATTMVPDTEMRPWVERKESLDNTERVEEERIVSRFLNRIDDYMRIVEAQGNRYVEGKPQVEANESEEYKVLRAWQHNANAYLKVLKVGIIENADLRPPSARDIQAQGKDEYRNIIAKIEEFYKTQAVQLEQNMLQGQMTQYALEQAIAENDRQLNLSLAAVRDAIDGDDIGEAIWRARFKAMTEANVAGAQGQEVLNRISSTGSLREIGLRLNAGSEEERAVISGMKREAEANRLAAHKIEVEAYSRQLAAMLERNPIGKVTEQYLAQFQQMGLMLTNLQAQSKEQLEELCSQVMAVYLEIGRSTRTFDITTAQGLESFRDYLAQMPHISQAAQHATDEILRALYYESYQYAESYTEAISRLIERQKRIWTRMYEQSTAHFKAIASAHDISQVIESARRGESYGGSTRLGLGLEVELNTQKYNDQLALWQHNIARAQAEVRAMEQSYESIRADAQSSTTDRDRAFNDLERARQQLDVISAIPQEVATAADELTMSMTALTDATLSWVSDIERAFETFAEGFVPLRSWYEDNGSLVSNVFGTREERQEAFAAFIDDVKKTVRQAITEHVRLRVQKLVQEKLTTTGVRLQEKLRTQLFTQSQAEQTTVKMANDQVQMQSDNLKTTIEATNSDLGTAKTIANKTTETTGAVAGNLAQAVSKAFADLGPIGGAIAAGVVSAAIGAVLTMAMNALGSSRRTKNAEATPKTKLVTGMLTYDRGNVSSLISVSAPAQPFATARTGLVTRPTPMMINGEKSIVGELGPEIVIGRETTTALMLSAPEVLRQIALYDRSHSRGLLRAFDRGNVSEVIDADAQAMSRDDLRQLIADMGQLIAQGNELNAQLLGQLQRGIKATINKNGTGGLIDEVASGLVESRQLKNNRNVSRLFG